jgi:hypothetical protein
MAAARKEGNKFSFVFDNGQATNNLRCVKWLKNKKMRDRMNNFHPQDKKVEGTWLDLFFLFILCAINTNKMKWPIVFFLFSCLFLSHLGKKKKNWHQKRGRKQTTFLFSFIFFVDWNKMRGWFLLVMICMAPWFNLKNKINKNWSWQSAEDNGDEDSAWIIFCYL